MIRKNKEKDWRNCLRIGAACLILVWAGLTPSPARADGQTMIIRDKIEISIGTEEHAGIYIGVEAGNGSLLPGNSDNMGVGMQAGMSVVGSYNTATGFYSGYSVAGDWNTTYGVFSGQYVEGSYNTAAGSDAGGNVNGNWNTAAGNGAGQYVTGSGNTAAGTSAGRYVIGNDNIALGTNAGSGTVGSPLNVNNTIAIGNAAMATVNGAMAVGMNARATGINAIAVGNGAVATGSVAVGDNARAANGGAAFGDDAVATGNASAALGKGAISTGANSAALGSGSNDGGRANTVSVGSAGAERTISNVAAGVNPTDAVNVSQLMEIQENMGSQVEEEIRRLDRRIDRLDKKTSRGIAAVAALVNVTPYLPGATTINAGAAAYDGEAGLGLTASHWTKNGLFNFNAGVSCGGETRSTIVRGGIGIIIR